MSKELVLGAYEIIAPTFSRNAWRSPRAKTGQYATLPYWQEIAELLERGGFDFLFFAEALAYPMREDGTVPEVVIREAVQFPVHDALYLASGIAATVDRLGIVVTASTTAGQPYLTSRAFGTVDHLTAGRIGWNVVTSNMQEALVRLLGQEEVTAHGDRYARAEEYVDLCLKLWEGGWGDDAQPADKERGVFNDPAQVHWVSHHGESFDLEGYFPVAPSPQRTPMLFQAGTSPRGRDFAAKYAECVFLNENDPEKARALVADMRDRSERFGRPRDAITMINGASVLVGASDAEAQVLRTELEQAGSVDAMAALFLGWTGVDLTRFAPETVMTDIDTEVGKSTLSLYQRDGLTVRHVLDDLRKSLGGFKVTGTADQVARQLIDHAERSDIDGYLIEHTWGGTESYRDFVDQVVPLLRAAGALPGAPRSGTLREMLSGAESARLPPSHIGASYRR
jgi:FMN-dependent oxidoreductase (nitrilotriacetate monooxygenase family)